MNQFEVKSTVPPGVGLLQKAFQILDLFQDMVPSWSQAELARATGLPRSTTSRLVRYLDERGYLIQADGNGRYQLGPAAIELGRRASRTLDLRSICRPVLEGIAKATEETVILTALDEARLAVACVDQIESTAEGLRVFERVGVKFPLHAGAAPKAVLAAMRPEEQTRILENRLSSKTRHTVTDPDRLKVDLERTVERGYAVSYEETYIGVVGVASAFFGRDDRPIGSLAVAAPMHRTSEERIAALGEMLTEASSEITSLLDGSVRRNGQGVGT